VRQKHAINACACLAFPGRYLHVSWLCGYSVLVCYVLSPRLAVRDTFAVLRRLSGRRDYAGKAHVWEVSESRTFWISAFGPHHLNRTIHHLTPLLHHLIQSLMPLSLTYPLLPSQAHNGNHRRRHRKSKTTTWLGYFLPLRHFASSPPPPDSGSTPLMISTSFSLLATPHSSHAPPASTLQRTYVVVLLTELCVGSWLLSSWRQLASLLAIRALRSTHRQIQARKEEKRGEVLLPYCIFE
jgi:hypothetical protein